MINSLLHRIFKKSIAKEREREREKKKVENKGKGKNPLKMGRMFGFTNMSLTFFLYEI